MTKQQRYKNEQSWQQMREEIIYVIQKNAFSSKKELITYFVKYHSNYNIGVDELEVIIEESKYINELLEKNKEFDLKYKETLRKRFDDILKAEVARLKELEITEIDERVLVSLHTLFKTSLINNQLFTLIKTSPDSYEEIVEHIEEE
jgi:septum formation topological specificity factor MinE